MFETDRVSQGHVERLNRMHEVWVPTQFHVDTFVKSGVNKSKIRKVVQPVDTDFFDPAAIKDFPLPFGVRVFGEPPGESVDIIPAETFVFLSIFKWETRKGWDVLIKAYLQEFSGRDNTILYLLTNPYHSDRGFEHKVHAFVKNQGIKKPANGWGAVHIVDMHVPQDNLPGVYKAADVFVLPSRGEGWGRPHVEAMAMSLPVIATNWSGMTEYLTDSNSYPLPIDGLVTVEEGPFKGHLWAEPSIDALRRLMRHVYENPEEARKKGAIAREDVVRKYSLAVVGAQVVRELWRIHEVTEVGGHSDFKATKSMTLRYLDCTDEPQVSDMALAGDLQHAAAHWISTLHDGRHRLLQMVAALSSPASKWMEVDGGATSLFRWVENTMELMLEVVWVLEQGPDSMLDALLDQRQMDDLISQCYELLDEGQVQGTALVHRLSGALPVSMGAPDQLLVTHSGKAVQGPALVERLGGELSVNSAAYGQSPITQPVTTSTTGSHIITAISTTTSTSATIAPVCSTEFIDIQKVTDAPVGIKEISNKSGAVSIQTIASACIATPSNEMGGFCNQAWSSPSTVSTILPAAGELSTVLPKPAGSEAPVLLAGILIGMASPLTLPPSPSSIAPVVPTLAVEALHDLECSSTIRETVSYLPLGKLALGSSHRYVLLTFAIQPFARGGVG
ncbi:hypothetical protein CBR_g29369 [Chara braunii]|uniref:Uncharacterized protein n=1 Tax=Chara braunii TaxID=69332 RepID=A0A388JWL1_CHABU|nr:hypothetical protein CBR_g29369 [Chara braunii]|eukprot:GBG62170.1 hypothetical protein CBR_g29369 [Chara braunii]